METIIKAGTSVKESELELNNRKLAREAAAEGFVLLKNDGVLPLTSNKIALYGGGARKTVKGGTGSGAVRERYSVSIEEGLKAAGIEISTTDWLDRFDKFYADTYEEYRQGVEKKVEGITDLYKILALAGKFDHPTGVPVTKEDIENSDTDTVIYVLARQAGEGNDRSDVAGDYRLDDLEKENLKTVSENYKKVIIVVNVGGSIDLSFMDSLHVDSLVYFSQGGEEGGNALADVLTGNKNFSGKLSTSWAYGFEDIPSNDTYSYLGKDKYHQEYREGIYVGYRYFDSFNVKPRYPFGFGLSYTGFSIETTGVSQKKDCIVADILVKNTGDHSGKEVVQVYATVPFTDKGCEYQRLIAFEKTKELKPGEAQELSLSVPLSSLTGYREEDHSWVLYEGEYILRIGNSSDNTGIAALLKVDKEKVTEVCINICPPDVQIDEMVPPGRNEEKTDPKFTILIDTGEIETVNHTYETPESGASDDIKNKVASLSDEQLIDLVIGAGTSPEGLQVMAMGASGSTTPKLYEDTGIPNVILSDGPQGLNLTSQIVRMPDGSIKAARVEENLIAYRRYLFGMVGMGMKMRMADPADGEVHYQYATAWPCSQLLAQSWNTDLMYSVGDAVGEEMEAFGVTVWLAPGMNIHRNPLCGRTFEYYSEDPYLSGKLAAAIVNGVQSHPGKGMSIKHFVANNCELERNFSSSDMTERTLRELYLRGFEIAVKESSPMTVMAAYNKVNGVYCTNNEDTLIRVLRNEWGFKGLVMSDWDSMKCEREDPMKALSGDILKAHIAQCDLVMPGRPDQKEALLKGLSEGIVKKEDLMRSAERILTMITNNTALTVKFS